MSFTVLDQALVCACCSLLSTAALAQVSPQVLSCENAKAEELALKQAPLGARRISLHVLEVVSKKGPQRFIDKAPHDEGGMAGLHWRYCGYNSRTRAHLIEKTDAGLFSGKLLLDETGKQVHAGHTVVVSPSGKTFLAIEQESGTDGEEWAVYTISGEKLWKGYAGTTAKVDGIETVRSTLYNPQWTREGELTAHFVCTTSAYRGVIHLVRSSIGDWRWQGHQNCS